MGRRCVVAKCVNHSKLTKTKAKLFLFPSLKRLDVRNKWISVLGLDKTSSKVNVDNFGVCTSHFLMSDYEKNGKLHNVAVPSVNFEDDSLKLQMSKSDDISLFYDENLMDVSIQKNDSTTQSEIRHDMKLAPVNCKYILTSHLNQDYLENSFSTFRSIGCTYMKPTAVEAKQRVKKMVLNWNTNVSRKSVVENEDNHGFFTSTLLTELRESAKASSQELEDNSENIDSIFDHISTNVNVSAFKISDDTPRDLVASEGGKEYVAGFVIRKLCLQYPELICHEDSSSSWVSNLSHGHLAKPSGEWMSTFKKFDEYFETLHEWSGRYRLNLEAGVVKKLVDVLCSKFPNVPLKAIKLYALTRTTIRVKSINKERNDFKLKRRNAIKARENEEANNFIECLVNESQIADQDDESVVLHVGSNMEY